jgi:hypothetical protein
MNGRRKIPCILKRRTKWRCRLEASAFKQWEEPQYVFLRTSGGSCILLGCAEEVKLSSCVVLNLDSTVV